VETGGSPTETLAALVSRLGARIAHDLNNVCAVLGGHLYLLRGASGPEPADESLDAMDKAVGQIQRLTRSLGKLGGTGQGNSEAFDLNEIVRAAAEAWPFASSPVRLDLEDPLPSLSGRPRDVRLALDCLLVNAKEASAEEREIRVRTRLDREGRLVRLAVEDSGRGMSPEVQQRAFEPLFTTKEKGFGIGLPIVAAVAAAQGGRCEIDSEPGRGTRATLLLAVAL
jgi:signal transduction histidine kinase